uniref:Uncharacterized protein n=1 Tax=Chroomonas placoidea TaxID=173977 RepID=A0A2P1G815_9CRYP|nr:hypothetical protein CplaMt_p025 [Chroomonas placoidea]AVM81104.1 hypothetical protein CplaMt_p025 [Chroomonas placoidea]
MIVKANPSKYIDSIIFLSFKKFFLTLNKTRYLTKSSILLFFIFRKVQKKYVVKQKSLKIVFFLHSIFFSIKHDKALFLLQTKLFIELNLLSFQLNKKVFQSANCLLYLEKRISKTYINWIIKKEFLEIKLNDINFLILFDKFKELFKNQEICFNIFKYYQVNKNWLKNEIFFKKIFFAHLKLFLKIFDSFILYLFRQINKIFSNRFLFGTRYYFNLFKKNKQLYLRNNNNFLISIFLKNLYIKQMAAELFYFIKKIIKSRSLLPTVGNFKVNAVYFVGYYMISNLKTINFALKANLVKIVMRFFFLGYLSKFNKVLSQFVEYFRFNQLISLIKLKLILQSLNSYYKLVNNKKYLILKIILILKVSISKVFTSKFKYKSRAQILKFFKTDLSRFIFNKICGMSRSLVYRICFGYRIS